MDGRSAGVGLCVALTVGVPVLAHAQAPAEEGSGVEQLAPERSKRENRGLVGAGVIDAPEAKLEALPDRVVQVRGTSPSTPSPSRYAMQHATAATDEDPFADVVLVGGDDAYWCTGVLLDTRRVLTAGHCAHGTRVGLGNRATSALPVTVTARRIHPRLDIAELTLAVPAEVDTHRRRTHADTEAPLGAIRIMGFGVRDRIRLTGFGTKRQLDIPVDGWGCTSARSGATGCKPADELVVRGGQGNDTCLGDSGGPVFELVDGAWRLLAITSRGLRPRKVICGEGGIYVRVDRISQWLEGGKQ